MMKLTLAIAFIVIRLQLQAAQPFIKAIDDPAFGSDIRIVQSAGGWVVFSLDSMRIAKFSDCGIFEWGRKYSLPNRNPGLRDFIRTGDGGFAILTRMQTGSSMYVSLITKLDASGNIAWSKSYEDPVFSQFPYTLLEDSGGNLCLFMNVENMTDNSIFNHFTKISSSGDVLWGRFYDHGWVWGSAIPTSDNGYLFRTGSNLIKIDASGNAQWNSMVTGFGYYFICPAEVADGYIFTGYTSGNQQITFSKVSKSGAVMLGGCRQTNLAGYPGRIYTLPNGHIAGVFQQAGSSSTLVELDKDLNVVSSISIGSSAAALVGRDVTLTGSLPAIAGVSSGNPFFASLGSTGTACDIPVSVTHTIQPLNQQFANTSVTNHTLTPVTRTFASTDVAVSTSPICNAPFTLELGNDTSLCSGFEMLLYNKDSASFESYLWSTGETTPAIEVQDPGKYVLTVVYNCGQDTLSDSILVASLPAPEAELGADRYLCAGQEVVLSAPACDSCSYAWSDGSSGPALLVSEPGSYWVEVTHARGCSDADTVAVEESKCECSLFLPSAFSPNHDGRNDVFAPAAYCDLLDFSLKIFNRWGELVFETADVNTGWNGFHAGSPASSGLYPYLLSYTPVIGGLPGNTIMKKGSVTLIY